MGKKVVTSVETLFRGEEKSPRILLLDIETLPSLGFTWGKWQVDVIQFQQEGCVATFAAKWLGEKEVIAKSLHQYPGYKPKSYDDRKLLKDLHKLLDEADVIVAHNGRDFDARVINSRFLFHNMPPPSPYKIIDTKVEVKKVARFNSNKLDDLGKLLLGDKKLKTDFDLWLGCVNGDKQSWERMLSYNIKDTLLLERIYLRLRPWIANHPNLTLLAAGANCPKCASSKMQKRGFGITGTRMYQRLHCQSCGGWSRGVKSVASTEVA